MRRATDPIAGYRFVLELGFIQVGGFSECTGLQLETKVFEYPEGGRNSHTLKFPERGAVSNIVLKRGIVVGANSDTLFNWFHDVMTGSFDPSANPNVRPLDSDQDIDKRVTIVLRDEAGEDVKRWQLRRVFPVKWVGPELKAAASEVAVETLELACEGVEVAD